MKNPLPREIVPGIFWLGQCLEQHFQGNVYHAYNAAFLIVGSKSSLLVETGHPGDFSEINRQVKEIALPKKNKIEHLFITHRLDFFRLFVYFSNCIFISHTFFLIYRLM